MARKKVKPEEDQGNSFVVLFASLSIILLAFFILLNSIAVIDDARQRVAFGSLLGSFGLLPGGMQFEKSNKLLPPQSPILSDKDEGLEATMQTFKRLGLRSRTSLASRDDEASNDSDLSLMANLSISLGSRLLFKPGSAKLKSEAAPYLNALANLALQTRNNIVVEGHTDDVALRGGPYRSNWELSGARAVGLLRYLERRGVARRRLKAVGRGSQAPVDSNDTVEGRARNRRVDVKFIGPLRKRNVKQRRFDFKGFTFSTKI